MSGINEELRQELLAMRDEDLRVREELAATGELFEGYNKTMEAVHLKNAARLEELIKEHGWLGKSKVGEDGAEAAWVIAQHAISLPEFSRRALRILELEATREEVPLWQVAYLEDRINFFEGKPQQYGTQFDWNEKGEMLPHEISEPEKIDERRESMGLTTPYSLVVKIHNDNFKESNEEPLMQDFVKRQKDFSDWAQKVGWRE